MTGTGENNTPADGRAVDVFLHYLRAEGAEVVFGVPGGLLHPLFAAVENDPNLRLVVTKHEEGAAFMADGFARTGGRLAVCAGTSGPGSTNLITGVSCAFADGVPMLVITGQAASSTIGKGAAQEAGREDMDIVAMFDPVTKYSAMVVSPGSLAHHLRRALRLALTGRPGPVHLNVPVDLWEKPVEEQWFEPSSYRPETSLFDRRRVQQAAEAIIAARHPVILAGSGVRIACAEDHLRALAELLSTRVATTPRGKGLFPEDHPLSMGVLGFAGHAPARDTILGDKVDLLLTVGASLNETTTLNWDRKLRPRETLVQLDIDPDRIGRNYPVEIPLVGDAQTILVELVYHIHRLIRDGASPQSVWGDETPIERNIYTTPNLRVSDAVPVTPQRWRVDFEEALPDNAVVFSDIGGHMLFNIHHLRIREEQKFIINMGFGSMGHGTAAPIGAALADPGRPVIAIVGDGCFAMNGMELLTAREYDIPVTWIVENNNMHGIVWHGTKRLGGSGPLESARFRKTIEVAAIARAMGLGAWVVERPDQMQQAMSGALKSGGPAVIEVRVDAEISPPVEDRARAVEGFIAGR